MSKSSSGLLLEQAQSREFHRSGIPLLISPALLRNRDLGQLDLARMTKSKNGEWKIEIAEVKSSAVGEEQFLRGQRTRILAAGKFLSGIFGAPVRFILSR